MPATRITFRYCDAPLATVAFDAAATNQRSYVTLSDLPPYINTTTDSGRTLSGRAYSHALYSIWEHDIIISSDELDNANVAFFAEWWRSAYAYISRNGQAYTRVSHEGGRLPVEYIDGREDSPELTLKLSEVAPC